MGNKDIPRKTNFLLWGILSSILLSLLLVLPAYAAKYTFACAAAIILFIPINTPYWSLIHEGIHRHLHPHKTWNEFMGRSMAIILGNSFHVLRFGHLMHHQYNRSWESEIYEADDTKWKVTLTHYFKMLGGLYLIEVLLSFILAICPVRYAHHVANLAFSDEHHQQAVRQMLLKPETVWKVRTDCTLIVALYGTSLYLYSAYWPLLALAIGGRALIISLMDNAYHYGTPLDNSVPAKELYVPMPIARMMLNFNYHMTHHTNAGLPWPRLSEEHRKLDRDFDDYLVPALLSQFKGPIPKEITYGQTRH